MIFNLKGLLKFLSLPFKCIFKFQDNVKEAFGFFRMNSRYLKEFEAIANIKKRCGGSKIIMSHIFSPSFEKWWNIIKFTTFKKLKNIGIKGSNWKGTWKQLKKAYKRILKTTHLKNCWRISSRSSNFWMKGSWMIWKWNQG